MKLLFPMLGAAALGLYALSGKKAHAASAQSSKPRSQQRAEWLAAIAHAKGQSYEQYVKVLNEAYKTGLFTSEEIAKLQKQHPNFPKAGSGSTQATAKPGATAASGPSIEQRVADALATNNPAVMRKLADEIRTSHPQAAADLDNVATALEKTNQTFDRPTNTTVPSTSAQSKPPVAPAPVQTSSQVKKKKPKKTEKPASASTTPVEAGHGPGPDERKQLALDTAKMLTLAKKGREDRSLVERFQRSENQKRVLEGRDSGLTPDGRYGLASAYAIGEYNLVPPKPLYWGKANDWKSVGTEKAAWKRWCLENANKDAARRAEWTAASKV